MNKEVEPCLKKSLSAYESGYLNKQHPIGTAAFNADGSIKEDGEYLAVSEECLRNEGTTVQCPFAVEYYIEIAGGMIVNYRKDEIGKCKLGN